METPIKTECVNSGMDVGDQNEDDLDGNTLELADINTDSSDSEDNLPLQNISKLWKADRSNVSEIKTSKILKPDARGITLSKEEQLQQMLERSKSLNYQKSPFKCDLCYKGFVDIKSFENHQEKHAEVLHLSKKRQSDNETEKEIQKSQAPLKKIDKGEENKAQNQDTRKIPDLRIHSNAFKNPYIVLNRVKTHIKTLIPKNETTTFNINSDIKNYKIKANSNEQVTAPNNIFKCDVCKNEYLRKSLLENHIRKWHIIEFDSKQNSLPFEPANSNYQNCKNTNLLKGIKNNIVTENNLSKNNKNKLKDSICSDEKEYKCSYCTKCFSNNSVLTRHVKIHTGEKPYKCNSCTKCFTSSGYLASHVRIHTGEQPYKCSYCTKCFTSSSSLASHVRIHTGVQPYKCSYCVKCFTNSSTLALHQGRALVFQRGRHCRSN